MPGVNWPVRNGRNDSFHSSIEKYLEPELPLLKFHLCPEFCTAFVGIHRPLKFCPVCNAPRFTSRSDHLVTGTPNAVMTYRTLIFWITELLQLKGFLPTFLHEYHKPSSNMKYKYMDVTDAIAFKDSLYEKKRTLEESAAKILTFAFEIPS